MIIPEQDIDEEKLNQLIGKPLKQNWRKPKVIGSPGLFLKTFVNNAKEYRSPPPDSKCNLEKRSKGLLLHTNYSNKQTLIPIPEESIQEIKIIRGKERINPIPLYPMWILLKLGVPILKARYFGMRMNQYSIEEMKLSIKSEDYEIELVGNGYLFERQLQFLKTLDYGDRLIIEREM